MGLKLGFVGGWGNRAGQDAIFASIRSRVIIAKARIELGSTIGTRHLRLDRAPRLPVRGVGSVSGRGRRGGTSGCCHITTTVPRE